jgi:uncharacterized membrane protein
MKALLSLIIGGVCILIGLSMQTSNKLIIYFLLLVGIVNIYIAAKDIMAIFKGTK